MAKVVDVFKAILTRLIFAGHGFIAIWRVTTIKSDPAYWYLSVSLLVLAFEGIFTLTIKANQEWRWFCPSVFLYLSSVVPSIWLLEFDKLDRRLEPREGINTSILINGTDEELQAIQTFGVEIKIPVQLTAETWATVIEQFLMLILIIGRWLLPKGELTREQLSQLLLVYIGTAADIIEFFDSFKDEKVAYNRVLCIIILSIWSWSLLQFCMVLTSKPKAKKAKVVVQPPVLTCARTARKVCCSVDVWSILINILLQDAPFFTFRLLLILHYKIISYMNIFFTCKNTLVIFLQFYRLIVVQAEKRKALKARAEGVAPAKGQQGQRKRVHSNLEQQLKTVKNTRHVKNVVRPAPKSARSPRRATARLIRNASEDDGTVYPSPAHSGAYLLCETDSPWRHNRGRRRSLSTGDLSATAELSVDIESSPDRSTCFSGEQDATGMDPEVGDMDSELEGEGLCNVEEDAEENDDVDSQASEDIDEYPEDKEAIAGDSKRKMNRYSTVDEQPCPIPAPRSSVQASGSSSSGRPVPTPRKTGAPAGSQYSARSPGGRSVSGRGSQSQRQSLGVRERDRDRDRRRTPRQDTGYSTASSSTRESPGNGRRDGANRSSTPNRERERESRRPAAVRPRELRGLRPSSRASDLQELHEMHELSSPARSSRSSKQSQRPSNRSGRPPSGRQEISIDDETQVAAGAQPSSATVT